jgi:hypothetical protein
MEEEKMKKMKQYLLTLRIPDNISTKMIKYLEKESIPGIFADYRLRG